MQGSIAAGIQSGIGNVVSGSAFAVAQSIGAGGALPALGFVAGAASGGFIVAGVGYGIYHLVKKVKSAQNGASKSIDVFCEKCGKRKRPKKP